MSSSDSGEDFESADEDLDVNESSKNKKASCVEQLKLTQVNVDKEHAEKGLQDVYNVKIKQEMDQHNRCLELKQVSNEAIDTIKNTSVQSLNDCKPKTKKKLGTKLTANSKISESFTSTQIKPERSSEKKYASDYRSKTKEPEITDNNKTKELSSHPSKANTDSVDKFELSDKSNLTDGWDVEEEDGFEIPLLLGKMCNNEINCLQEKNDGIIDNQAKDETQGWGGWGSWGVGSLISTATGSVTTFSNQVTAGLSTVLETTVGAPDPESLAATTEKKFNEESSEKNQIEEDLASKEEHTPASYGGFGSIVSGVSFLGNAVINRGLDTLETLGKKTMEVLQEGDPGLMKKRAMLFPNQDKPVLSQILREAKEKAENSDKEKEEKETARRAHFESLFDDFQGMIHLEALEMLSTQCELKLQSLLLAQSGSHLADLQETMSQVRDLCEVPDDEDDIEDLTQDQFTQKINKCLQALKVTLSTIKIILVNDEVISRLDKLGFEDFTIVHQTAISSLAEFTAAGMECFHKSAELLMAKPIRSTPNEAEGYVQLTIHLCGRVSGIANEFTQLLTRNDPISNSSLITNIFLEASNSCTYIRNACQLLVPILQVGSISS